MNGSKALLPLVEIVVSIGIFAIAVVLTLQLFLLARFLGNKTSDTARAIFEIQNVAEEIKTFDSAAQVDEYFAKLPRDGEFSCLYYDKNWEAAGSASEGGYVLKITRSDEEYNVGDLYNFKLSLYRCEPYPFINDKNVEKDPDYLPLLANIVAAKVILTA
ncbi:hypothetical protein FACS1894105_06510 [Clostridia bacterium]|nr:hypothetical protein FACS1894105_06510 [Clostridia bacterium]